MVRVQLVLFLGSRKSCMLAASLDDLWRSFTGTECAVRMISRSGCYDFEHRSLPSTVEHPRKQMMVKRCSLMLI